MNVAIKPSREPFPAEDWGLTSNPRSPTDEGVRLVVRGDLVLIEAWGSDGATCYEVDVEELGAWLRDQKEVYQ